MSKPDWQLRQVFFDYNDYVTEDVRWARTHINQLEQERDQLAARVKRLEETFDILRGLSSATHTRSGATFKEQRQAWTDVNLVLNESPTQSLAAHNRELLLKWITEVKAKEKASPEYDWPGYVGHWLRAKAAGMEGE